MWKQREFWIRSIALTAVLLCCGLAIAPLYLVVTIDAVSGGTHWATLFDVPGNLLGVFSGVIYWLLRAATLLLVAGIILICGFRQFPFRFLPVLLLSLLAAEMAFRRLYPKLEGMPDVVSKFGFSLLVALGVILVAQSVASLLPRADKT